MVLYTEILLYVFSFIIGACVGSAYLCFLDRKNRKESWLKGRSHCNACGHELKRKDLIPIASYIALKGKCRYCKTPYTMSTLLSELTAGCAFLFGTVLFISQYVKGNLPAAIIMPVVFIFLGIASVNDIYCHECSYITQGIIFFGGIGYAFIFKPVRNVAMAAICCVILSLIDLLYRRLRKVDFAIGFADITVITGVSCIIEPIAIPFMLFFSCVFALVSIPIAKKNQSEQHTEEDSLGVGLLPFVTYGAFVAEILAEQVAPYLLSISA